ncbi:MAG: hypothetical protein Q4G11_07075, partial [Gallicola sp.]|nr:hypothetical protein [Gallicola sp.]
HWCGGKNKKVLEEATGTVETNFIRYIDLQMRYYLGINPEKLNDEEWAETYEMLKDIREKESGKN